MFGLSTTRQRATRPRKARAAITEAGQATDSAASTGQAGTGTAGSIRGLGSRRMEPSTVPSVGAFTDQAQSHMRRLLPLRYMRVGAGTTDIGTTMAATGRGTGQPQPFR